MRRSTRRVPGTAEQPGTWRLWLIVGLWILLVAQFVVGASFPVAGRQPFPVVTMPVFGAENVGTDARAHVAERTVHVINRDGTEHTVNAAALLAPLPPGPASQTLDRLLRPSSEVASEPTDETVKWLKAHAERLELGPDPVGLRVTWQPVILDIRTLARTPAGPATVREVRW
ncbi:hypothetical protein [Mycobacterium spongiae]|uniref:hypothetical protein n=1 Tax=Mycobacterium spongiae TaxID=886343 RepID=UPI001BA5F452|nr:hypothetical protein [Mycobacterium spongiae]